MSGEFAALLGARRGWRPAQISLFDSGFSLYWTRSAALARRTRTWPSPRLRHVAVVAEPTGVRPYSQLLNTSAWVLYASDLDSARSHPEWVAYLLAHGDRMVLTGEVTSTAVQAAAWWIERTDDECVAFAAAAARAARPDAAGFQAIAAALPWLRALRHVDLCPPRVVSPHRTIPGTGLLVPQALEHEPPALIVRWRHAAQDALRTYRTAWAGHDPAAAADLVDWLAHAAPPLIVTAGGSGRIVWDPAAPERVAPLRHALADADAVAVRAIHDDLRVVERHTRAFLAAVVDHAPLAAVPVDAEQRGYSYLHRERRLVAYNLDERGMERRSGTPLPFARAMLGARTVHEWAHLADAAGWVPRTLDAAGWQEAEGALADALDVAIASAPPAIRARTAADLARLAGGGNAGPALVRLGLTRLPDYRANLLARHFLDEHERETYVRHNIRTLRPDYPPEQLWRMLVRYLAEYQYLGAHLALTRVADPRTFLWQSTWFADDFVASSVLDEARFDQLACEFGALCRGHAVDETRFRMAKLM